MNPQQLTINFAGMISARRTVLDLVDDSGGYMYESVDPDQTRPVSILVDPADFVALGGPHQITVTIEPGNTLEAEVL